MAGGVAVGAGGPFSATAGTATPGFSKQFAPDTIGPGSTSTLTFTIDASTLAGTTEGISFTDNLPAGVTIADPASATTTCPTSTGETLVLSAPAGGGTISLSGAAVGANSTCTVSVNTTSSTPGTHTNTSDPLMTDAGQGGTATDDLTVETARPGFSKDFAPDPIDVGERSTLTFTVDNSANASPVTTIEFTDTLPAGLVIADPNNAVVGCAGAAGAPTLSAAPGTASIAFQAPGSDVSPVLAAGASCTVSLDVVGTVQGVLTNVSSDLIVGDEADAINAGKATASLTVEFSALHLTKEFTDDPIPPGGVGTMEFVIENIDRSLTATDVAFTDTLPAGVVVANPPAPTNSCGGTLTAADGTGVVSLAGGSVPAGAPCTITVGVTAPAPGAFENTTGEVTGTVGGTTVTGNAASDTLFVTAAPVLTKEFVDDPVGPGGTVTLRFTITDTTTAGGSTDIAFVDQMEFLGVPLSATLPADGFCGAGASMTLIDFGVASGGVDALSMTGGSLGAGEQCTFDVTIDIPAGLAGGPYTNTTDPITATVERTTVAGNAASDDLEVVFAPALDKEFTDDPIAPGDTVTLEFTLAHDALASGDATDITFTDDLTFVTGLTATGLPLTDLCGPGNGTLTGSAGDTLLTFSGGTLAPDETCTFSATLQSSASTPQGIHLNQTSDVSAAVGGVATTSLPATADLVVTQLALTKTFTDDPVTPGSTVTLEFTIENSSTTDAASDIAFTDDLDAVLSGLAATGLPASDVCGAGSQLSGTSVLTLSGGSLGPSESCTFAASLQVPFSAPAGVYGNVTTGFSATVGNLSVDFPNAADSLQVVEPLVLTKEFVDDPVDPGDTVTLEFTLTNNTAGDTFSNVNFTDDLDATLTGLAAEATSPATDPCGPGSSLTGASVLAFQVDSLGPGASCTFSALLRVPADALFGTYPNTTSDVNYNAEVSADPATDDLRVAQVRFADLSITKSDSPDPVVAGTELTYTIEVDNAGPSTSPGVVVTDFVPAGTTLVSTSGCAEDPAGAPTCSLGTIPSGGSASYTMTVLVDPAATGTIDNESLVAALSGANEVPGGSGDPAGSGAAMIALDPGDGEVCFELTLDGVQGIVAAAHIHSGVAGVNGPVVVDLDWPVNGAQGCVSASDSLINSILAAPSDFYVNVHTNLFPAGAVRGQLDSGTPAGAIVRSTDTTDPDPSNNGASATTAIVAPSADVSVSKSDGVTSVVPGSGTDLVYTIVVSNAGPSADPAVAVADVFPAVLTCSYTSTAAGGASGNTASGSGDIADTVNMPVGSSVTYTATCAVDAAATATISNTATATTSLSDPNPSNNSATDTTEPAPAADVSVSKTDGRTSAVPGEDTIVYTIVVSNAGPSPAPSVSVSDVFPAALSCTWTSAASGGATGNTAAGSGNIADTLSLPAGAAVTYTTSCAIDPGATGTLSNTVTATVGGGAALIGAGAGLAAVDPNTANNSATDTTSLVPEADLSITKDDGRTEALAGQNALVYTIRVANAGPSVDPAARVVDNFPAPLTCSWTSVAAGGASGNSASGSGSIDDTVSLPPGSSVTYTATCSTPRTASGTITNTATVTASVTDPDTANNSATDSNTRLRPPQGLPATGGDSGGLVQGALLALVAGLGLWAVTRMPRRRTVRIDSNRGRPIRS